MSIYITPQDELHVEYQGIALTCPHCQTLTHLTPMAVPKFEELSAPQAEAHRHRVSLRHLHRTGIPEVCRQGLHAACAWNWRRNFIEIERARENFPLTYLPEDAEGLFKEALNCYAANCFNAFGAMSRRTAQSLFHELGERGKLELFDTLQEIRSLADARR